MYELQLPSIINSLQTTIQKCFQFCKQKKTRRNETYFSSEKGQTTPLPSASPSASGARGRANLFNELIPKLTTFPKKKERNLNLCNLCPPNSLKHHTKEAAFTVTFLLDKLLTQKEVNNRCYKTDIEKQKSNNVDFAP